MRSMCVVALAHQAHPDWPLILIGNRDEFHGRPTAPLARWPGTDVLAGRDLQSGGTWMGLGRSGRAAVVTNVRAGLPPPFSGPSRGALPLDFLQSQEFEDELVRLGRAYLGYSARPGSSQTETATP